MVKNILEYLEMSERRFPEKTAYTDRNGSRTFRSFAMTARRIGTCLAEMPRGGLQGRPAAVFMEKSVDMIECFMGIVYAGGFYCPVDTAMPEERIRTIFSVLQPAVLLVKREDLQKAENLLGIRGIRGACGIADREEMPVPEESGDAQGADTDSAGQNKTKIVIYEEAEETPENPALLQSIRRRSVDSDPLYVLFTSGSTGVPKGVLVPHRVIINNMEWLEKEYGFTEKEVLANQVPFYFDVSDHDIYSVMKFGCSCVIVPPAYFAFPARLVQFLNEYKVTAVFWVPFALCMAANLDAFRTEKPQYLRFIFFAGEVMPMKQLNYWRRHIPDAVYCNMYGPTETYVCTYYNLDRKFADDEALPIGHPVSYADVLVLDEENCPVLPETAGAGQGELCVRGCTLALGYYNSPEKTAERFVQNPLNDKWPEIIYRTGDLVSWNERGELVFLSRKDFQIKHLGYRIELGEIEAAAGALENVRDCACVYDNGKKMILLVYSGEELPRKNMLAKLSEKLPKYMLPNRLIRMTALPRNANGKIDRKELGRMWM